MVGWLGMCVAGGGWLGSLVGCADHAAVVRLSVDNDKLRGELALARRVLADRDATIHRLTRQVETLHGWGADKPVDLFAPVTIEILSRSGGYDDDGAPGDDGVVVYVRPRDADGHAVKVPGAIRIELTDASVLGAQRSVGVYDFDGPSELRSMWYAAFGTDHYTARCPFFPGVDPPAGPEVTVNVQFRDYLTGATLSATKAVPITPRPK